MAIERDDSTDRGRGRHARWRRSLGWAVAVAVVFHAAAIAFLFFPTGRSERTHPALSVIPMPHVPAKSPRPELEPPVDRPEARERVEEPEREEPAVPPPAIPVPVESPDAPLEETIPETTLRALQGPVLPLEAGPTGVRRRTPPARSPALTRARAESLVNAQLAELPGAQRRERGAVALADGGVSFAIPWQGFVRDGSDEAWRRERCEGGGDGEDDKAGEKEGRAAQCD